MKIGVGLSGGVDSSVTLALLKEQGYDVFGVTMKIWDQSYNLSGNNNSSCFGKNENKDIEDADKICKKYSVPYYIIDLSKEYKNIVLNYFEKEYINGRTPNPCVICNSKIKFGSLIDKLYEKKIEFDYFATGHYAIKEYNKEINRYLLKKSVDLKKDQSYFLSFLTQEQLSKIMFPLGYYKKEQVRELAKKFDIHTHNKKESQDFYSGDYKELINVKENYGNIRDIYGKIIGKHKGIHNYTIGQRKGINVSSNKPLYIISINKENNEIVVGPENFLFKKTFIANNVNWIYFDKVTEKLRAKARIRYLHKEENCLITPLTDNNYKVEFDIEQKSITPGQIVVFYDNDYVLGGGYISF